jgi:hypothetical protein
MTILCLTRSRESHSSRLLSVTEVVSLDRFQTHMDANYLDRRILGEAREIAQYIRPRIQEEDGEFYRRPKELEG